MPSAQLECLAVAMWTYLDCVECTCTAMIIALCQSAAALRASDGACSEALLRQPWMLTSGTLMLA